MPGRNEFYEDLALWSTLSVGRNQRNNVKRQIWQRFLDDLCYLCDTEPGGRTTVSIAVSEFEGGQCYWITANGGSQKAVGQLTLILEQLQKIRDPCVDHEEIKDKILFAGIRRSSMKVRNYLKELRRYIRVIETRISHPKVQTFRALLQLETYGDIPTAAYRLRSSQDYLELKDHIARNPGDSESRHIRHYLGRLASWAKSVDLIVQASHSHSLIHAPIKVHDLPSQQSTILAGPIQKKAVDALVASLFRAGVEGARELCESRWLPVLDIYTKRWQSLQLKTAVHAEIIILDYFHRQSFAIRARKTIHWMQQTFMFLLWSLYG